MKREFNFCIFTIALLIMIIIFIFISKPFSIKEEDSHDTIHFSEIALDNFYFNIESLLTSVGRNTVFFADLSSLDDFELDEVEHDFFNFMKGNEAYYQIRYIDETGQEKVRVDFDGNEIFPVPLEDLQYKGDREYFIETSKLSKGELYISPLDLNKEGGVLENRGTLENPIYVPVIRYSTPVYDVNSTFRGIVISNIYADYFLENIRNLGEREQVYLVNQNGDYLANADRTKEYTFDLDTDSNFFTDFGLGEGFFKAHFDERYVEVEDKIYLLRFYVPDESLYQAYLAKEKLEIERYWVFVYVLDKS